jgi:hypothetical protein
VAGALHDSLRALESQALVVTFAEGAVALARQEVADLAESHVAIHLRVAAARDVVAVARVGLLLDLDLQGIAAAPQLLAIDERLHRGFPAHGLCHFPPLVDRRLAHRIRDRARRHLSAVTGFQRIVDVLENGRFDAPLLQHGQGLWIGHRSFPRYQPLMRPQVPVTRPPSTTWYAS